MSFLAAGKSQTPTSSCLFFCLVLLVRLRAPRRRFLLGWCWMQLLSAWARSEPKLCCFPAGVGRVDPVIAFFYYVFFFITLWNGWFRDTCSLLLSDSSFETLQTERVSVKSEEEEEGVVKELKKNFLHLSFNGQQQRPSVALMALTAYSPPLLSLLFFSFLTSKARCVSEGVGSAATGPDLMPFTYVGASMTHAASETHMFFLCIPTPKKSNKISRPVSKLCWS